MEEEVTHALLHLNSAPSAPTIWLVLDFMGCWSRTHWDLAEDWTDILPFVCSVALGESQKLARLQCPYRMGTSIPISKGLVSNE